MFRQVASSADFVNIWETEIINSSQDGLSDRRHSDTPSDWSTRKHTTASTDTCISAESSNSQDGLRRSETDRSTRKRSSTTADLSPGLSESDEIIGGPSSSKKQCDYVSEGIDQRIERCRKGIITVVIDN